MNKKFGKINPFLCVQIYGIELWRRHFWRIVDFQNGYSPGQHGDQGMRNTERKKIMFVFQAILGGVVGFWGGVFCMGSIFLSMVLVKRCIHRKSQEDNE